MWCRPAPSARRSADLLRPLRDGVRDEADHAQAGDEQRDRTEQTDRDRGALHVADPLAVQVLQQRHPRPQVGSIARAAAPIAAAAVSGVSRVRTSTETPPRSFSVVTR